MSVWYFDCQYETWNADTQPLLPEKYPNLEFLLVRIFTYSDWIQENRDQKKLRIWILFTQCLNVSQCENLDAYQKFAEFNESSLTKCNTLSLNESKYFWRNDLQTNTADFAEFMKNFV